MAKRSFSLMLAWRYLNPRRAMLSAVTLISVIGVMLGVLVLVVVMSIYNGLEKQVKERLLGYSPHIRLEYAPDGETRQPIADWRRTAEEMAKLPGVQSATAFMQDYSLLVMDGRQKPVIFRGVDTSDKAQVAGIQRLLATDKYPASTADMGLDNRVVISSVIAKQFAVSIGDKIKLYSMRNLENVRTVYEITGQKPTRERFADQLKQVGELLARAGKKQGDQIILSEQERKDLYNPIWYIFQPEDPGTVEVRKPEKDILSRYLMILDACEEVPQGFALPTTFRQEASATLEELNHTDVEHMDAALLKGINEIVLPKEAEIVGVYQASNMAAMPDVFMPLPLAQELCGLQDSVQGIAIRLNDPYAVAAAFDALHGHLPEGWTAISWLVEFGEFSRLIQQQRIMMYFALSFIILVSSFSMMAVMFTVTIQKRREIGVMKALGAATRQIIGVFVYQGMILGIAGSALGVAFGLMVIYWRAQLQELMRLFEFDPFPADFNGFHILPADPRPLEISLIAIMAFILCTIAAFVPAFFAARSDAAKSLRNL